MSPLIPADPPLFTIRTAKLQDLPHLQMICQQHGLGTIATVKDCSVAVNHKDIPVGFIHIEHVKDDDNPLANGAYVYPVAVYTSWQNLGVARALITHELAGAAELKLVACKPSQGFYPKVGFTPVSWDLIATRIAHDCDLCALRTECAPIPFILSDRLFS